MVNIDKYTRGLVRTFKGKDDTFFVINDSNIEFKQHYDPFYKPDIDYDLFRKSQKSKEDYFKKLGINYGFFVIADKTIVLRDDIPFETPEPERHVDHLKDCVHDTAFCLNKEDYLRNDTHPTPKSCLKLVPYFLSVLHDDSVKQYEDMLSKKTHIEVRPHEGDLFYDFNWSQKYGDKIWNKYHVLDTEFVETNDDYTTVDMEDIPEEFRKVSIRDSQYYINPNSVTDKKALILHDSTALTMIPAFISYYREVFFYWDHLYFSKDLVEWFNPDDVLEIHLERFLHNVVAPIIDDNYTQNLLIRIDVNRCELEEDILNLNFDVVNVADMHVPAICDITLNDELIFSDSVENNIDIKHKLKPSYYGYSRLKIHAKQDDSKMDYEFNKEYSQELCFTVKDLNQYFNSLNGMMIAKDENMLEVNDKHNELKQHYDSSYNFKLNIDKYNQYLKYKSYYLKNRNIKNYTFSVADKSVVIKDKLPFELKQPKRIVDKLDSVIDLYNLLDEESYRSNDTRLTDKAQFKVITYILSVVTDKSSAYYNELLLNNVHFEKGIAKGNLTDDEVWSYKKDEFYENNQNIRMDHIKFNKFFEELDSNVIPEEFRTFDYKEPFYYRNSSSLSDKKLLIFFDSTLGKVLPLLTVYFREVLVYNSKSYFLTDVIEWFKPDIILELYQESLFDNLITTMNYDGSVQLPIKYTSEEFIKDSHLNVKIVATDVYGNDLETTVELKINGNVIVDNKPLVGGVFEFEYDVSNMGYFLLDVHIRSERDVRPIRYDKVLYEPIVDKEKYFESLKKTMVGKSDYLFLVNDRNNEIRQHYDKDYEPLIDYDEFKSKEDYKRNLLESRSIPYFLFIIPDKSVMLQDYLPFKTDKPIRICDNLKDYVNDLSLVLDESDYFKGDTHTKPVSALKIVPYILSKYSDKSYEELKEAIESKIHFENKAIKGDLFMDNNWSYGHDKFYKRYLFENIDSLVNNDSYHKVSSEDIPEEFRKHGGRESLYYINENSISDKKAIILRDSQTNLMIPAYIAYYREVFFYWNHFYFNEDLIYWFKPDEVIGIKTERLFNSPRIKFIRFNQIHEELY